MNERSLTHRRERREQREYHQSPYHEQLLEDAETWLAHPKSELITSLDDARRAHSTELVLLLGLLSANYTRVWPLVREKFERIHKASRSRVHEDTPSMNLIVDGDHEGEERQNEIVSNALDRRIAFAQKTANIIKRFDRKQDIFHIIEGLVTDEQRWVQSLAEQEPPSFLSQFSEYLRANMINAIQAIELNRGCSVGCMFCGVSAEKKVRESLLSKDATWFFANAPHETTLFYYATDPLDFHPADHPPLDYSDFVTIAEAKFGHPPFTSSTIPRSELRAFHRLGERMSRMSFSLMNRQWLVN